MGDRGQSGQAQRQQSIGEHREIEGINGAGRKSVGSLTDSQAWPGTIQKVFEVFKLLC